MGEVQTVSTYWVTGSLASPDPFRGGVVVDKPETLPLSVPAFFDLGAYFPFPLPAFGNFHDAL